VTAAASARSLVVALVQRDRRIVIACLALLCALAWWWLWRMSWAPASASPGAMSGMAGMPGMARAPEVWSLAYLGPTFLMWAIMMVAMMLPSAAPMILFHGAVGRKAGGGGDRATLMFALAYLLLWTAFAGLAAIAQAALVSHDILGPATLAIGSNRLGAALLVATTAYQLSPLKRVCLSQCRSPVGFLMRHWRPGIAGAARMGLAHGLYCIGCCGVLMLLLFVGGVMNLAWVALLSLIVLAEKYAPARLHIDRLFAVTALAAALALVLL
jgi:predicted metal-binding membrane protein